MLPPSYTPKTISSSAEQHKIVGYGDGCPEDLCPSTVACHCRLSCSLHVERIQGGESFCRDVVPLGSGPQTSDEQGHQDHERN